jgi:hypothetical protein
MTKFDRLLLFCLAVWISGILLLTFGPSPQAQLVSPGTAAIAIDAGCTPYHLSGGSAASTNSTEIKGVPARLCDLTLINTTTTLYYLRLYDTATAPTCSSATGVKHVYPIPFGATNAGGGIQRTLGTSGGEAYANGIGFCLTGAGTDTDTTNAATGVYIEGSYRTVPP